MTFADSLTGKLYRIQETLQLPNFRDYLESLLNKDFVANSQKIFTVFENHLQLSRQQLGELEVNPFMDLSTTSISLVISHFIQHFNDFYVSTFKGVLPQLAQSGKARLNVVLKEVYKKFGQTLEMEHKAMEGRFFFIFF